MALKILLVEDDISLAQSIKRALEENGFFITHYTEGLKALESVDTHYYDLVILDIVLPDINGFEICRKFRQKNKVVPILILSAKDEVKDKVKGLDLGANDYLTKPFDYTELLARVRAHTRPREYPTGDNTITYADIILDLNRHTVSRNEKTIPLTPKEFSLLEFMMRAPEKLHSRVVIEEKVWDRNVELQTNIVDVYVNYLRKKLNTDGLPNLIHAIRGYGYMLELRAGKN